MAWPPGFVRVPDEDWTRAPVESLATKYDRVDRHGWYDNLDPTVEDLRARLRDGDVLLDYSGGTGILEQRLLPALAGRDVGVVIVDSSPKFLRLALEKFRDDRRVAFRLLRYLKDERRLQLVDEVLPGLAADALVSANAVHLYTDLEPTLRAWARVLRPGAALHVQSGNVRTPGSEGWIIDDTVHAIAEAAEAVVREDARFARWRAVLDDAPRMRAHAALRRKVFPDVRPVATYEAALRAAGFEDVRATTRPVEARASEWLQFLSVYAEAVLGWIGGSVKVEGAEPSPEALADRAAVLDAAAAHVFGGKPGFTATWTYLTARRGGA